MNRSFLKCAGCLFIAAALSSCGSQSKPNPAGSGVSTIKATEAKSEPGVVELSSPKVTRGEGGVLLFEINYRFTSGSPVKTYLVDISFPGTTERGLKPMEGWELKSEGVIKTGIQVSDPSVSKYSIIMSEADSPDLGYTQNSNVLTGEIEPLETKSPS